jgi:excisionase family DNA binding protein
MALALNLYSAEQVAELLNLHVKTVRRYVRDGRLKAKRIGKEYRITRRDLEAFAGELRPPDKEVVRTRDVIVSSIVDVDAIGAGESDRATTMIMASLNARKGEADFPRVDTIYYPEQARLRLMITAGPVLTCELVGMIDVLLRNRRDEHR